jgi:hypothetical protein
MNKVRVAHALAAVTLLLLFFYTLSLSGKHAIKR